MLTVRFNPSATAKTITAADIPVGVPFMIAGSANVRVRFEAEGPDLIKPTRPVGGVFRVLIGIFSVETSEPRVISVRCDYTYEVTGFYPDGVLVLTDAK